MTHEQEIAILLSRVETESAQRLNTFKHDLARVLRVEYADYSLAADKPMTVERGEAYRDMLADIFALLQRHGVDIA